MPTERVRRFGGASRLLLTGVCASLALAELVLHLANLRRICRSQTVPPQLDLLDPREISEVGYFSHASGKDR